MRRLSQRLMAAERRRNRQDPINGGRPSVCRTCPGGIAALSLRPSRILFSRNESTPLRLLLAIQATRFLLLTEYIVIMYPRAVSNLLRDHLNVFSIVVIYQPIVIVSSRRIFLFFSFIYIYVSIRGTIIGRKRGRFYSLEGLEERIN